MTDFFQASTLYGHKYALQFWIDTHTPNFSSIEREYRIRVLRHIRMVAVEQDLSTQYREKNELGEFELGLLFAEVMSLQEGALNTKQHYIVWVLSYITSARPGSITVGKGYHKGAPLGGAISATMPTRAKSHTLRWSDLKFEKFDQEYCCVVTFLYLKGSNDPHNQSNEQGTRRFFFAPKQERLQLDLSALLFAEGKAWTLRDQIHTLNFHSVYSRLICRPSGCPPQQRVRSIPRNQAGSGQAGCIRCGNYRV